MKTKPFRHTKWWTIAVFAITLIMGSCQKQDLPIENNESLLSINSAARTGENIPFLDGGNTLLGESKQNPYTVSNMTAAWQSLSNRGVTTSSATNVHTTHYYVKFKPQTSDQYEELHKDTTLTFSDLPIESAVTQNGDYYHDPSLPDSVPTYQYTAVKTNYQFPDGIPYEIIDNLYIPEIDGIFNYEKGGTEDLFVNKLLNQAYTQTGNYEDTIPLINSVQIEARKYTPGGRIRVFDTRLQQWIGMEGVRVEARRWFIIYSAYTDFNGNYRMNDRYKNATNYSIWFARETFSVRHNLVNTTFWINGPKIEGDWNYDLNNEYQRFAGHVFRGAFRYHNKNIGGLQRPWLPSKRQVYVAKDGVKDWSGVNWIVLPVIRIARYGVETGEYDSDEIFSTTCHETGHSSHVLRMNGGVIQYWQVGRQLQESWPIALEWFLSHLEYAERGINNYGEWNYSPANPPQFPNDQAYQYWNLGVDSWYTSLYINIADNVNEFNQPFFGWGLGTVNDQVTGYTLPLFERRMLKHCYGLSSLGTQLKNNRPAGVTNAQIDLLLSSY